MLFLFVSLEFHSSTLFSGNGTYGRSLVASMAAMGHNVQVVCAIPSSSSTLTSQSCTVMGDTEILNQSNIATNDDDGETDAPPSGSICGTVSLFGVDVPERKWKRVDRLSAWREWTEAFAECTTQFLDFASNPPDALFFVDWSSLPVAEQALSLLRQSGRPPKKVVFLNFRVFSRGVGLNADDIPFYSEMERRCVTVADVCVALSRSDALLLHPELCHVVPCPLRTPISDKAKAQQIDGGGASRTYILCCVRRAPEKNLEAFVQLIQVLPPHLLSEGRLVPFVCGAIVCPEYDADVRRRLLEIAPQSIFVDRFLTPDELGHVFSRAVLNVHPALYEAYGMTMVEAAAFGCPSLAHYDPSAGDAQPIGVHSLLRPDRSEILSMDLSHIGGDTIDRVVSVLVDIELWTTYSTCARRRSLEYTQDACGRLMMQNCGLS